MCSKRAPRLTDLVMSDVCNVGLNSWMVGRRFGSELSRGNVRWRIPLSVEHLANFRQHIEIISTTIGLVSVGNMPGKIYQHDAPSRRILPQACPDVDMLATVSCPDTSNLKGVPIVCRRVRHVESIWVFHSASDVA